MAKAFDRKRKRKIVPPKPLFESCIFCKEKGDPDYKDVGKISQFITDRMRILPRSRSALCAKHQRRLAIATKRARYLSLLPFTPSL